ncbi:hypothetical protein BDV19DRAFT_385224 [Aspergillus venezuelensis]
MATSKLTCARWSTGITEGRFACKDCLLVAYCGPNCQKWKPTWVQEGRTPAFVAGPAITTFGVNKYLWGNMPALVLLQLEKNEGKAYGEDIRLLFAASGDLRNVVKTIAELPSEYKGSIEVIINDRDSDIVSRNIILLLIALMMEGKDEAQKIRPFVKDVWDLVKQGSPFGIFEKLETFGSCSVKVYLERESWKRLLSAFEVPAGLTTKRAQEIHSSGMCNNARKDYRDRFLYKQSASHRLAYSKFWQDGLLLPFGSPCQEFCVPNPTFFQNVPVWPMKDDSNPLNGWSPEEVAAMSVEPAISDIYGKLFFHLRETLHKFIDRLRGSKVSFMLFQLDVEDLTDALEEDSFDRIEVSNICDLQYLNTHRTLLFMAPFLQLPVNNSHATLVILFMNTVPMILESEGRVSEMGPGSLEAKRLLKYMPLKRPPTSLADPDLFKLTEGMDIIVKYDRVFGRYMKDLDFKERGEFFGAEMKAKHTIISKWPYQLKLNSTQPGAKEEFERLLCSGLSSKERYVEWKRFPGGVIDQMGAKIEYMMMMESIRQAWIAEFEDFYD